MNTKAFLTFRKDYLYLQERILKKLDTVRLKFDKDGIAEKKLFEIKLRDSKEVRGKTKLEGKEIYDYITPYTVKFLTYILTNDYEITKRLKDYSNFYIIADLDERETDGKVSYYIIFSIHLNK